MESYITISHKFDVYKTFIAGANTINRIASPKIFLCICLLLDSFHDLHQVFRRTVPDVITLFIES